MSERCERTSERRSEWPIILGVDSIVILPNVHRRFTVSKQLEDTPQDALLDEVAGIRLAKRRMFWAMKGFLVRPLV